MHVRPRARLLTLLTDTGRWKRGQPKISYGSGQARFDRRARECDETSAFGVCVSEVIKNMGVRVTFIEKVIAWL